MYAPIVMFVYNRTHHFEQAFRALAKCPEAAESELFIFSDGPRNESDSIRVAGVRRCVRRMMRERAFMRMHIEERKTNMGLSPSVIDGVSQIIEKFGRVIVIEDDAVVSPYFLKFMNAALDYYEDDNTIGSIAGYTPAIEFPDDYRKDVFTAYRSCSFGWATWRENWDGCDWELKDIKQFMKNRDMIKRLNANGSDRFKRLYNLSKGVGTSWSVRFGAHMVKNNWLTIYPRYSYVINIGNEALASKNTVEDSDMVSVDLDRAIENFELETPEINQDIQKALKNHYSQGGLNDARNAASDFGLFLKSMF
jgi:hypothetical protein